MNPAFILIHLVIASEKTCMLRRIFKRSTSRVAERGREVIFHSVRSRVRAPPPRATLPRVFCLIQKWNCMRCNQRVRSGANQDEWRNTRDVSLIRDIFCARLTKLRYSFDERGKKYGSVKGSSSSFAIDFIARKFRKCERAVKRSIQSLPSASCSGH